MSEHITHLAVFDDSARLALHSPEISDTVKQTLRKHWEVARMDQCQHDGGDRR